MACPSALISLDLAQISLFTEFNPRFVVRQQRPLGCCGQPIFLGYADWFCPSATVRWRVDIGAGGN